MIVREGFLAEENGSDHACPEISGCVGRDGVNSESPNHASVCETNGERDRDRRDEWIGGVETRPDDQSDKAIHHEFLEEQMSLIRLVRVRERTEDTSRTAIEHSSTMRSNVRSAQSTDLRPITAHQHQARDKRPDNLADDVVRYFLPGETLPDGERDRDGRIEVATGDGGAGDDGEGDAEGEGEADLQDVAVEGYGEGARGAGGIYGE